MRQIGIGSLLVAAVAAVGLTDGAVAATRNYALVSNGERIGKLAVVTSGRSVQIDWRVDDNGRGPKLKEQIELDSSGMPVQWQIEGTGWVGAPVKESFSFKNGTARWKSLDDEGEAKASRPPLYLPNNSSPWALGLNLRVVLASPDHRRAVLPSGEVRAEQIRQVQIGEGNDAATFSAWALWGLDLAPTLVLADADGSFEGFLAPGFVFVDEKFASRYDQLSRLAQDLSADLLRRVTRAVTHAYPGPIYLTNARIFDPAAGALTEPTTVVVFGEEIVSTRPDAPRSVRPSSTAMEEHCCLGCTTSMLTRTTGRGRCTSRRVSRGRAIPGTRTSSCSRSPPASSPVK